jgi:hypothetical protein
LTYLCNYDKIVLKVKAIKGGDFYEKTFKLVFSSYDAFIGGVC